MDRMFQITGFENRLSDFVTDNRLLITGPVLHSLNQCNSIDFDTEVLMQIICWHFSELEFFEEPHPKNDDK